MKNGPTHKVVLVPLHWSVTTLIAAVVAVCAATMVTNLLWPPYRGEYDWRRAFLYRLYKAGWHPSDGQFTVAMQVLQLLPRILWWGVAAPVFVIGSRLLRRIRVPHGIVTREDRCSNCGYDLT